MQVPNSQSTSGSGQTSGQTSATPSSWTPLTGEEIDGMTPEERAERVAEDQDRRAEIIEEKADITGSMDQENPTPDELEALDKLNEEFDALGDEIIQLGDDWHLFSNADDPEAQQQAELEAELEAMEAEQEHDDGSGTPSDPEQGGQSGHDGPEGGGDGPEGTALADMEGDVVVGRGAPIHSSSPTRALTMSEAIAIRLGNVIDKTEGITAELKGLAGQLAGSRGDDVAGGRQVNLPSGKGDISGTRPVDPGIEDTSGSGDPRQHRP
jgi:hypothetical protein